MPYIDALSRLELDGLKGGEKPWCDLVFEITDADVSPREVSVRAMGTSKGVDIGIGLKLPLVGWKQQQPRDGVSFYYGIGALRSLGKATDQLVKLYADWFEFLELPVKSATECVCTAVGLNNDPSQAARERVATKFFFESTTGREDEYAELFVNLDLPGGVMELREEDPFYRTALVRFLSGTYACGASLS